MRRLLLLLLAGAASPLRAQMDMQHTMEMHAGPLGIPETRMGSSTSWLPEPSPMHAAPDAPLAPVSHHWQDGTHITFRVVAGGVLPRNVKPEASWCNGRDPDEIRTNFAYAGRRLDSYSARLTVNPGPRWSLSTWYAYLKSPEGLYPDESLHRIGVAALTTRPVGTGGGAWSSALIYGAHAQLGTGRLAATVLVESTLDLDGTNSVFGRVEYVRKSAEDLVIPSVPPTT